MILPYLKKNGKFSLYDTVFDIKEGERGFKEYGDNTNKMRLHYEDFDFIHPFVEGFAIAKNHLEQPCFINKAGNILETEKWYSKLRDFEKGIGVGYDKFNKLRFYNKSGREIIDQGFDSYHICKNGFIRVRNINQNEYSDKGDENGLLDSTGFLIFEPQEDGSYYFLNKNLIEVYSKGHLMGYFDANGEEIFDKNINQFYGIGGFENGRSIAELKTDEYAIIDEEFNIIKKLGTNNNLEFSELFFFR